MRLKKIKLAGFKSFVDATNVNFPKQMTCVVGPNGCGKSNIIDAVRWVLGESSAKNLRAEDMTDVIFNGSTQRKPVSQSSVELVFENTQGRIKGSLADRNEVSIKRIVTRERKSTYFLNGEKCRRKDVTEIFLGTGMGARSYSIIEQGMISKLIESKPQELRVFLEEAAGISKYKERRRDTENRIKNTKINLERLEDVRHEIGKSIEKLRKQSTAAAKFKELKIKERELKSELATLRFIKFSELGATVDYSKELAITELEKHRADCTSSDRALSDLKVNKEDAQEKLDGVQKTFYSLSNELTKIEQQITHTKQQQNKLKLDIQKTIDSILKSQLLLTSEKDEIKLLIEEIEAITPALEIKQEKFEQAQDILLQKQELLDAVIGKWERQLQEKSQLSNKLTQASANLESEKRATSQSKSRLLELQQEIEHTKQESSIDVTSNLETQLDKINSAIKTHQNDSDKANSLSDDITAKINDQNINIEANQKALRKLESKLDSLNYLQNESDSSKDQIAIWLKDNNIDNESILTHINIKDGWEAAVENALAFIGNPLLIADLPDKLPSAHLSAIIKNSGKPKINTLASVIESKFTPDIFNLIELHNDNTPQDTLSIDQTGTLRQGNWIHVGSDSAQSGYFTRKKEIQAVEIDTKSSTLKIKKMEEIKLELIKELEKTTSNKTDTDNEIRKFESQQISISTELKIKREQQDSVQKKITRLESQIEDTEIAIEQSDENTLALEFTIEELNEESLISEEEHPEIERKKNELTTQTTLLRNEQDNNKTSLHQLQVQHSGATSKLSALKSNLARSEELIGQHKEESELLTIELEETHIPLEEFIESQQTKLEEHADAEDNLVLTKNSVEIINGKIIDAEKGQSSIKDKENHIQEKINNFTLDGERHRMKANSFLTILADLKVNMKDISETISDEANEEKWEKNLEATTSNIQKLGAVNLAAIEEFEKENARKQYLDQQNDDLVGAIETLEAAIAKIDKETRAKFKETFTNVNNGLQDLFPKVFGGGSAYLALTDDNLLEAGVTIMAQPPGKKNSTIHLLSGGEKALTALSLVFSIFKLNPSPFCMLDEVDAPLDDVNVGRFCNLVQEMSETVQFIYISHNKVAMEMAHQLAGVTMHEPGVSRLVDVDIAEAHNLINE